MDRNSEENRLSYLLSGSYEVLPPSYIKLRSYLNIHSAKVAEQHGLNIFQSRNKVCPYCYSSWSCDTSSFKLLPSKKLKVQFKKRVNVEPGQKEAADELRNILVLRCKVCCKKSSFSLVKKKKIKIKVQKEEENVKNGKRKKKKKDRSCGLLMSLEKTVTPSPQALILKKKIGLTCMENKQIPLKCVQKNFPKFQPKSPINSPNSKSKSNSFKEPTKRLVINPFAPQAHSKLARNKQQKLKALKKAVKSGKDVVKKTLQDFLNLI